MGKTIQVEIDDNLAKLIGDMIAAKGEGSTESSVVEQLLWSAVYERLNCPVKFDEGVDVMSAINELTTSEFQEARAGLLADLAVSLVEAVYLRTAERDWATGASTDEDLKAAKDRHVSRHNRADLEDSHLQSCAITFFCMLSALDPDLDHKDFVSWMCLLFPGVGQERVTRVVSDAMTYVKVSGGKDVGSVNN